jgi:HK97 family phage major capsid protein
MKSLANAAGGNTSADITSGPGMTFLGYPVEVSQVFPSATASGQIPVVFGNFRMAGMLGDRRQETIAFSDTATVGGQSVWERDQIAVKGSQRFDIVIHDFGSGTVAGPIVALETT